MSDLSVFVVSHKPTLVADDLSYIPIQVGKASDEQFFPVRDNSGEHVSGKNAHYCELTAHYWIWKNCHSKYVGLMHYRRYLSPKSDAVQHLGKSIASGHDLIQSVSNGMVIIAEPIELYYPDTKIPQSVEQQFLTAHSFELISTRRAIEKIFPEYVPSFDAVMRGNRIYAYNMLVCSKQTFDDYSSWLFEILNCAEAHIQLKRESSYQSRIMGFISERLFTVWMAHNQGTYPVDFRKSVFYAGL